MRWFIGIILFDMLNIFNIFNISNAFLNFKLNKPFLIKDSEYNKKISYTIPESEKAIIKKINGFYGMIGPDINITNIDNLFNLFTGDGIINGVFIENGEITVLNHFIRTEKIIYEQTNGKFLKNSFSIGFNMLMNKLKLQPNIMGVANTAILNVNNRNEIYALFERDLPYKLNVNFKEKTVETIKKLDIKGIEYFSGHSKYLDTYTKKNDYIDIIHNIHTLEYNILLNTVNYHILNDNFERVDTHKIKMNYIPIVHDFIIFDDGRFFLMDSPLKIDFTKILTNVFSFNMDMKIYISLQQNEKTYFRLYDPYRDIEKTYVYNKGLYCFHYAYYVENNDFIEIYSSVYKKLDFTDLDIYGIYSKITINKKSGNVDIISTDELKKYNLDFPVKYKNYIILRNIYNNTVNGFVVCKGLEIVNKLLFDDIYFSGEPVIVNINEDSDKEIPYLISFAYDENQYGYLIIIKLFDYSETTPDFIKIPLNIKLNIGFHSIFIPNK
jgi:carotenoid cleavage dioxygenase-like enzyme